MESAKRRGVKLVRSLSGKTPALNEIDTLVEQVDAGAGAAVGTSGGGGGGTGGGVLKGGQAGMNRCWRDLCGNAQAARAANREQKYQSLRGELEDSWRCCDNIV